MLAIDIGNSRIKWALFIDGLIKEDGSSGYSYEDFENKLELSCLPDVAETVMVSCVAGDELKGRFEKWASKNAYTNIEFAITCNQQHGIVNSYLRPEKLGVDRWLAMVAAYRECEAKQDELICVIDCGTAITIDVLNSGGVHQGGLIMPGYQVMIQSMFQGAKNIKNEKKSFLEVSHSAGLGNSTADALVKGCSQIIVQGISGIISGYQKESTSILRCIVTGGDGCWISSALTIENVYDPFLVLKGLNIVSTNQNSK